jgi:hypothetical protein
LELTQGALDMINGSLTLTSGNVVLTSGNLTLTSGNLNCTGQITLTGAQTISSTLGVTGTTSLAATLISTTLGVTGTTTLGVLNAGASTLSTAATTTTLAVGTSATVGTTLGVTGISTLGVTKITKVEKTTADFAADACDLTADVTSGWLSFNCAAAAGIGGAATVALPTPGSNIGRILYINMTNTSGQTITFTGTQKMGLVDDATALACATAKHIQTMLFCDGTEWVYVASA